MILTLKNNLTYILYGLLMNVAGNFIRGLESLVQSADWKVLLEFAGGLTILGGMVVVILTIIKMIVQFFKSIKK